MIGAARHRPPVFSALILAGLAVTLVVVVAGRTLVTEVLAGAYLALVVAAVLKQALQGSS